MIAQSFLSEFDYEAAATRKMLERLPDGQLNYKPHEKSMTCGALVTHIAMIPMWLTTTISLPELDVANFQPPQPFETISAALEAFDAKVAEARAALEGASDEAMMATWSLRNGEHVAFSMPRVAVIRTFIMNHLVHHRGQLSVYLRLLDIPVPAIYGPSADEGTM
jgi:uncharacterized damage-inducible protein DinB